MEKRKPGRPRAEYPYLTRPKRHGRWWRILIVTGRSGGKRESYYHKAETLEGAQQWAREFKRQIAAGGRTIQDSVDEYIEHLRRNGNKSGSIDTARFRLRALLGDSAAGSLIDLNAKKAQALYDALVDRGIAADTHRGCLISGRAFGKFCITKGWLRTDPFKGVLPVGRKSRGKEQLRIDEARVFMRHCYKAWKERKDRGAVAGLLALMFSMRASEVSQLLARDIDDNGRVLRIAEHEAKTIASRRAAEVPPRLVPILLELAANPATPDGHLFATAEGAPADRQWVYYHVKRHLKAAGVPVITVHGLRGTAATIGSVATGGAAVMAAALGHEDEAITKDAYIDPKQLADAQTKRVAGLLDEDE
jgi:integrase